MFNFLGRLFGSDKALEKTVDAVTQGLDKLVYTSEEEADDAAKERTEARQMVVKWMDATQGQNLARRFIAFTFTVSFILMLFLGAGTEISAIWLVDESQRLHETSKVILEFAQELGDVMWIILGFYFSAPYAGDITKAILQRKAGGDK